MTNKAGLRYSFRGWAALAAAVALCLAGCGGTTEQQSPGGGGAGGGGAFTISTSLSTVIPTVATVTWSIDGVTSLEDGTIDFGLSSETYGMTAPTQVDGAGPWQTILIGMKPSTEYHFRITGQSGSETYLSGDHTVTTGALPSTLPATSTTVNDASSHAQGFMLSTMFAPPAGAVILDSDGDFVWAYLPPNTTQLSRARLTPDRRWVYMWSVNLNHGGGPGGPGGPAGGNQNIIQVRIDGTDEKRISLPDGHHDFTILSDGTIAYIEYDVRTIDNVSVSGDRLMELAPDGSTTEVYTVWNDFEYGGETPAPGEGWCHANYLEYDENDNVYYMGSKTFGSIMKIDRATGTLLDVFGGAQSDFTVSTGGTTPYQNQHGFQVQDDHLLVFDNGSQQEMASRGVEYSLDEASKVMTLIWSYTPSPTLFDFSLGNVQYLQNGNRLVTFSTSGQVDEVDSSEALVFRLNLGMGGALGYLTWMESLYE